MKLTVEYRNNSYYIDKDYFLRNVKIALGNDELYDYLEKYFLEAKGVDDVNMVINLHFINLNDVRRLINENTQTYTANQLPDIWFNPEIPKKIKDLKPKT